MSVSSTTSRLIRPRVNPSARSSPRLPRRPSTPCACTAATPAVPVLTPEPPSSVVQPAAAGAGQVLMTAPSPELTVGGGPYTVPISLSNASRLSNLALTVTFNPAVLRVRKRLTDRVRIDAATLLALPAQLAPEQAAFQTTGGLHACALFDRTGKLLALREDVGRHNALDKLIGWALLEKRTPLRGHVALLSGRASFEMMQKAHAAGVPVVAAISAPSSLAVEFARASGQTLAGFVRGRSMNLYAGTARVKTPAGRAGGPKATGTRPTSIRKGSSGRRRA